MGSVAQAPPAASESSSHWAQWLRHFLAQELAPYPGRAWVVARMTIAATLMMLCIMTFQLPGAALGAYFTLLFSRESAQATLRSALTSLSAIACSLLFVLFGVAMFSGDPFTHFLWVAGTLFVMFFLISTLNQYQAGTAFGFLAANSIPNWDFPGNVNLQFQNTLWTGLAVAAAALITVAVELVTQRLHPFDQLMTGIDDRLRIAQEALTSWAEKRAMEAYARQKLIQYAMTGTATLRRLLLRAGNNAQYTSEMSALVALTGRLIDLSANRVDSGDALNPAEQTACQRAAANVQTLRAALARRDFEAIAHFEAPVPPPGVSALVTAIENTIARIPQVFSGILPLSEYLPSAVDLQRAAPLFKPDTFTNPDHVRFALKGLLAGIVCYLIYNGLDWRGLSTSIATCMITALTTVGTSRQKQFLRFFGAIVGSVILGMSAQVFVLYYLGGITGFTVLFVLVTAFSSWIATASPRLSYAGVQIAFAFYVTQLRTFGPQTSLAVARDDVMGIFLGLLAMWFAFDQIWTKDAAHEVLDLFVANLRRLAEFDRVITRDDVPTAIDRSRGERATISNTFDQIRSQADALIFEFGAHWQEKVNLRNQVRAWQPQLRTYFLLDISLLHYRLQAADRKLYAEAEQNVELCRTLLAQLADLEDPHQTEQAPVVKRQIQDLLGKVERSPTREQTDNNPLAISRSMLRICHDLARQMTGQG